MKGSILKLIVSIAVPLVLGGIAGIFTTAEIGGWYKSLNSPAFNPPNWVFGPVWTTLYILMGVSFYLIWTIPPSRARKRAIIVYLTQLLLNFLWSFIFFYFRQIDLAVVDIIVLWISIVFMLTQFYKLRPAAAYLNIPYLLWVSFAATLNIAHAALN